jgi:hypothetical protein
MEQAREFVVPKTSGNTHTAIVASHLMRADQCAQNGKQSRGTSPAKRFAGNDHTRVLVEWPTQSRQLLAVEMMEEQITDYDRMVRPPIEFEHVGFIPQGLPRPIPRAATKVEASEPRRASAQNQAHFAGAGPDFQDGFARPAMLPQHFQEPPIAPKDAVDEAQIASRCLRVG